MCLSCCPALIMLLLQALIMLLLQALLVLTCSSVLAWYIAPLHLPHCSWWNSCVENTCLWKSLLYSIRSRCSCDNEGRDNKQELHKMVTQKQEYKTWVARGWGGTKGVTLGWRSAENVACRKWWLHQVDKKGGELTVEWTDREGKRGGNILKLKTKWEWTAA